MVESNRWNSRYRWMIPILLLAFLVRIACLDAQSLWWDEAFSVTVGGMDMRSLMTTVLDDRVHPPLYYLILHFWLPLARSEFVVRVPSAFLGALAVACMFPMAALVGGNRLGVISAFALAISPLHIWYSQEARMYSLIVFLTLLANYFFGRILRRDQPINWLGYSIFILLAMHTHYLTLFVILAQGTYLILLRPRNRVLLRKWLLCMLIVGALSAPWLVAIFLTGGFYQASISWIRPAVPQDLFWTVYDFGLGFSSNPGNLFNLLAALSIVAILVYVSVCLVRGKIPVRQRNMLRLVWYWLSLPLIFVFLISLDWPLPQKRSIYMDRFLIPLLPAFLILVGYGITRIFDRKKALGALAAVILLVSTGASTCSLLLDQTYHRDDWRQAITEIRENAQNGDVLLVRPHHYVPLYYYDLQEIPWFTVPYLESAQAYDTFLDAELSSSASEGGRLWTMIVCENADPHRFAQGAQQRLMRKVEEDEVRAWLLQNRHSVEEGVYSGVHLSLYDTE
jgi:mannosyltransferase